MSATASFQDIPLLTPFSRRRLSYAARASSGVFHVATRTGCGFGSDFGSSFGSGFGSDLAAGATGVEMVAMKGELPSGVGTQAVEVEAEAACRRSSSRLYSMNSFGSSHTETCVCVLFQ